MLSADVELQPFEIEHGPGPESGLLPPSAPRKTTVLKVMLRKHALVAWKRGRIWSSVLPALAYSGFDALLYHAFSQVEDASLSTTFMAILGPTYLVFAMMSAMQGVLVEVVSEKESKMKIMQEIYGLTPLMYWVSWILYFLGLALVSIAVVTVVLTRAAPVINHASPVLFVLLFLSAYIVHFELAALIAVFFDKVGTAASVGNLIGLLTVMICASMQGLMRGRAHALWLLAGLLPSASFYSAFAAMVWQETFHACDAEHGCRAGLGLSWGTLWARNLCEEDQWPCPKEKVQIFSAGESMVLLLLDVLLYGFLSWWAENVWQGEYGTAKPLTFFLELLGRARWFRPSRRQAPLLEVDRDGRSISMSIRGLHKVYPGGKVAVEDLSLDFYVREVFAVLGHNGAGKTTAMNCLVGLVAATSGTATVYGCDVREDVEGARRHLSVCPQDNPFYDVFTVRQHLNFFASLRGVGEARVGQRIVEVLAGLGMPEKIDDLCQSLSGGQKRRLWVATALLGETPLVFLDEPTSGMDPSSRRELWQLLLRLRSSGCTIIFTTHYLEEADIVADRKAVLAKGKVQALGTSQDLKTQFGLGYHLVVAFNPSATEHSAAELQGMVVRHVTTAQDERQGQEDAGDNAEFGHVARYVLPYREDQHIGPLLLDIEARKAELRVRNYSLAMTSLEEVFMALGQEPDQEPAWPSTTGDFHEMPPDEALNFTEPSRWKCARAVARARLEMQLNDKKSLCGSVFMPLLIILLATPLSTDNGYNFAIYPPSTFGMGSILFAKILVKDKQAKCKSTAIAQGLPVQSYWLGTFCANYLASVPLVVAFVAVVAARPPDGLSRAGVPLISCMTVLYPVGLLMYTYNMSLLFETVEVSSKVIPAFTMLFGMIPAVVVMLMLMSNQQPYLNIAYGIHVAMSMVNPIYALPGVLVYLFHFPHLSIPGTFVSSAALPLYFFFVSTPLLAANLVLDEWRRRNTAAGRPQDGGMDAKDDDVRAEEMRIQQNLDSSADEAVRYLHLMHTYRAKVNRKWKETPAVRGISLGVRSGECFGLLGPNGAGKTTTLSALTGELSSPSSGRLIVCGHDISRPAGLAAARRCMGVCPQSDPLWDDLTGRQHMAFYGRVKGVPDDALADVVRTLASRLGFDASTLDKTIRTYSGGMKRKLSVCIALIGRSDLLFLDEPSAAVDVAAKRQLWKVIKRRRRGQTVVLTTHSMEEAEALCDRIAIQVQGQLRCLGSPLHLKQKYGSGYQLEIFVQLRGEAPPEEEDIVVRFVQAQLTPKAALLERHAGRYLFQLPPMGAGSDLSLGRIFTEVSHRRDAAEISDFSINQPSLEQVFLRFAREQEVCEQEEPEEEVPAPAEESAGSAPAEVGEAGQRTPFLAT